MNLMLVSVFWSFMLEIISSEQTKRLFGFIAAGGTAGSMVGPTADGLFVKSIGNSGVLYMGAGMFLVADRPAARPDAQWRRIAPGGRVGASAAVRARTRARRQSLRGLHAGAAQSLSRGHRAVHRRHLGDQHLPVLRAARAGGTEVRGAGGANPGVREPGRHRPAAGHVHAADADRFHRHAFRLIALLVAIPLVMVFGLTVYAVFGTFMRAGRGHGDAPLG